MALPELLRWQYAGYEKYHRSRSNLLLHIVVVPLFLLGTVGVIVGLAVFSWLQVGLSIAMMIVSIALQGRGHGVEPQPPEPFTGPGNAIARIFLEQWVTFPRFVLNGAWWRALRRSKLESSVH